MGICCFSKACSTIIGQKKQKNREMSSRFVIVKLFPSQERRNLQIAFYRRRTPCIQNPTAVSGTAGRAVEKPVAITVTQPHHWEIHQCWAEYNVSFLISCLMDNLCSFHLFPNRVRPPPPLILNRTPLAPSMEVSPKRTGNGHPRSFSSPVFTFGTAIPLMRSRYSA